MTVHGTIHNCNYGSADAVLLAAKAVEDGLTDDAALCESLDTLDGTLADYAADDSDHATSLCQEAEDSVRSAWEAIRDEVEARRRSRYRD